MSEHPYMKEQVDRLGITAEIVELPPERVPNWAADWARQAWSVTFRRPEKRPLYVSFYGGEKAPTPTAEQVLDTLCLDAATMENSPDIYDWAAEYGEDPDNPRTVHVYYLAREQTRKLKAFLGEDYETLLWGEEA